MKHKLQIGLKLIIILFLSVCFTLPVKRDRGIAVSYQMTADQLSKKEGKWHYFKKGNKIPVNELIEKNYELFDLPQGVTSRIDKEDIDDLGMKHVLFKLEIFGIPIDDAIFSAHYSKEGDLLHVIGEYNKSDFPKEKEVPNIYKPDAFDLAKNAFISQEKVKTQDSLKSLNNVLTELYEKGIIDPQLVYFRSDKKASLKLAYKVDIMSELIERSITYYIDAKNGNILHTSDYRTFNVATIQTVYNGSQTVGVEWRGWPSSYYYLRMEGYSTPFETRNSAIRFGWPDCVPWGFGNLDRVYKGDLNWPVDFKYNAASSHWAVKEAYTVFKNTFGRTYGTFSSSGGEIRMENKYPLIPFFEPGGSYDYIHVGNAIGTTNGFEGSLDIIGHEFTHGVMYRAHQVAGDPAYDAIETGSLMESFADIFGTVIEYYTTGTTDYIAGTNIINSFRRSLQNPRNYQCFDAYIDYDGSCAPQITPINGRTVPLYYGEYPYWISGGGKNPSYTNLSVQNYWFYLLANGGTQLGVTVNGIGISAASRIAYRNMVYYLQVGSTFDDMRQASNVNASILYGECSNESIQVMNAWAAVGRGTAGTPCISTEIVGPESLMCGEEGYYYANIHGGSGYYTYNWYVDYSYYSSSSSIYLSFYPEYDSEYHYITLEVSDGSLSDSDDQSIYVYSCGQGGLQSTEPLKFHMYPNPATNSTRVEIEDDITKDPSQYSIQIFDRNGRMVFSDKSYKTEFIIHTSSFQKGIYSTIIKKGKKVGSINLIIQ